MDQENIMFFENDDKSYTMVDLYLYDRFLGYKDSCNYYDTNVDKLLLLKKVIMNILLDIMMQINDNCTTTIKNKKFL